MSSQTKPMQTRPARCAVVITADGPPRQIQTGVNSITFVPLTIKRRHVSKVLLAPSDGRPAKVAVSMDIPLLRTLGKAYYWQKLIDQGDFRDAGEIARHFKLEKGWVCEVLRMTLLAPDIVQAILEGRQPRHLNLQTMRGRVSLIPVGWDEQRKLFGFAAALNSGGHSN